MKLSPEKQKNLILAILVVVGTAFGLWYFLVNGLTEKEKKDTKENIKLEADIKKTEETIAKEKSDREEAKVYQAYIEASEKQMPKGNPETWLVTILSEFAAQQKLQLAGTTIQPVTEISDFKFKEQPYKLVGFRFEFKGDLNQIGRFLQEIENKLPLMEVDDFSINAGSDVAPYVHTVSMRISMVTRS